MKKGESNKNMTLKLYNHNPTGKKQGDCVIRALGVALDKSWDEVYEDLVSIGRQIKAVPNNKESYELYLKSYPTIPVKHDTNNGKKRFTVKEISDWDGTFIVLIANHLTVIKENRVWDTWDCQRKCAYKIWRIK